MFKHYLKVAVRNLLRQKWYSFINIGGLAVGMACCVLLLLWVLDELSYDRFHENRHVIFRVVEMNMYPDGVSYSANTPAPVAPLIKQKVVGVVDFARFWLESIPLKVTDKALNLTGGIADTSFLNMFSFPLLVGDSKTALSEPHSIVLTEESAAKFFGKADPLGQILRAYDEYDLKVTGICADIPHNSHLQFDCLIPLSFAEEAGFPLDNWADSRFWTYVQLDRNSSVNEVGREIRDLEKMNAPGGSVSELQLQALTDIYLHRLGGGGPITYVYIFAFVACLVLIVACINFINLITARATRRRLEIGLRKTVGASRSQLIMQIMGETALLTIIALIITICLVEFALPAFNDLSGKQLSLDFMANPEIFVGLIGIALVTGLLSGGYPALFLSSLPPAIVAKANPTAGISSSNALLRKGLIVFQFIISIALIICTMITYNQLDFMRNKDLGIDKEHIVCLRVENLGDDYQMLKNEFLQDPNVLGITATSYPPAQYAIGTSAAEWEGKKEGERIKMALAMVDHDCIEMFGLQVVQGRSFSRDFQTDAAKAYILNEAAVRAMGLQSPIGKKFSWNFRDGEIIGVVKDFHFQALRRQIRPYVFMIWPSWFNYLCVKIKNQEMGNALVFLKEKWVQLKPNQEFDYFFLDQWVDGQYRAEQRMGTVLKWFTFLAVFISCLGIFGLASYSVEQRTKEIGIRKVLGASVSGIVQILSKEFLVLVVVGNFIAWPLAYYAANRWLEDFAYRMNLGFETFILAGLTTMVIALATVSFQSIKAALANPVDLLRHE